MMLSEYLKPALAVVIVVALAGGWYWIEHRPRPEEQDTPSNALVIVAKATNACFSDLVRVTGFIVPRREAVVGADQEGSRVTDLFVREGDMVTDNQEMARLTPPPAPPGSGARPASTAAISLLTEMRNIGPACGEAGAPTTVRTSVTSPAAGARNEIAAVDAGLAPLPGGAGGGVSRAIS
jgi:hypothetical protein